MAFPFVKLFRTNEAACFETLSTLIMNWAAQWFQLFPHPPLPLLAQVEALLRHWDPQLAAVMESCMDGGCQSAAWGCMQTLFSEILTKEEWLKVDPHLPQGV